MLFEHRYADAAERCQVELAVNPDDSGTLSTHALAMLALGRLDIALTEHVRANELASAKLQGESQPYLEFVGTIQWLLGNRTEAIRTFRAGVEGISIGSIKLADNAGGVSFGMLLWYAGVAAGDETARKQAIHYLEMLAGNRRIEYWPGPLALFALGEKAEADVLHAICGSRMLNDAVESAKKDLLQRRRLTQAMFYFATCNRSQGNEKRCASMMARCAKLENPVLEAEWYLARGEIET